MGHVHLMLAFSRGNGLLSPDVLIAGSYDDGGNPIPGYRLNGVWQSLPITGTSGSAGAIALR
ncbi:MAG: hypothetical protein LBC60_07070 [Spirochaetaceae bacterium]|nr:hypothetical protein [Spirochaetaceae bacterium]